VREDGGQEDEGRGADETRSAVLETQPARRIHGAHTASARELRPASAVHVQCGTCVGGRIAGRVWGVPGEEWRGEGEWGRAGERRGLVALSAVAVAAGSLARGADSLPWSGAPERGGLRNLLAAGRPTGGPSVRPHACLLGALRGRRQRHGCGCHLGPSSHPPALRAEAAVQLRKPPPSHRTAPHRRRAGQRGSDASAASLRRPPSALRSRCTSSTGELSSTTGDPRKHLCMQIWHTSSRHARSRRTM